MNLTNKGKFQIGNSCAKGKAGKKHLKTIVKEQLINTIGDFDGKLYELAEKFLTDKNKAIQFNAWKEIMKYRLPIKKELNAIHNVKTFEDYLKEQGEKHNLIE